MSPKGLSFNPEEEKYVREHYGEKSAMELGRDLGRSHKTIRRWLKAFGLEVKEAARDSPNLELTEYQLAHLRENWFEPMNKLGEEIGLSEPTVRKYLKLLGLERPQGKIENMRLRARMYRLRNYSAAEIDWHDLPLTRADAKEAGVPYFWDGQACERAGHISIRKTTNGSCWECEKEIFREKVANDPDLRKKRIDHGKKYWTENKAELLKKHRHRMQSEEGKKWLSAYYADKRENDVEWKIAKSLRDRLRDAIVRQSAEKTESAILLVGCSIPELKQHIESQFRDRMSWENYGRGGWHIDHIRPCRSFNMEDKKQQNLCFNWRNLQPLDESENLSKSDIYEPHDEAAWSLLMRELGYKGELFLLYEEGR